MRLHTALGSDVCVSVCVHVFFSHYKQAYFAETHIGLFTNPLFSFSHSLLPSLTLWLRAQAVSTHYSSVCRFTVMCILFFFSFLCELVPSLHELGCSDDCCLFSLCVFNWIHRSLHDSKVIPCLYLSQYLRPPIAPPSPWRRKVRCMSLGSREPMVGLQSQLSVSSTDAAAVQSGLWLQIISHPSSCLWKFAIWSLVSFHIVQNFSPQSSDGHQIRGPWSSLEKTRI